MTAAAMRDERAAAIIRSDIAILGWNFFAYRIYTPLTRELIATVAGFVSVSTATLDRREFVPG